MIYAILGGITIGTLCGVARDSWALVGCIYTTTMLGLFLIAVGEPHAAMMATFILSFAMSIGFLAGAFAMELWMRQRKEKSPRR